MTPEEFASHIIDLCAEYDIVDDYEIKTHENVILRCRIELLKGFVEIYRNFETGKKAFAWIHEENRIFGADNTGGWHLHPQENPKDHKPSKPISLSEFLDRIENILNQEI